MDIFLKLLEWGSSLALLPKILLSIAVAAIAGVVLVGLWSGPTAKAGNGAQPSSSVPDTKTSYITSANINELRSKSGVALIEDRHEGRLVTQLPRGVYGFCPPWMLNTDPTGVVGGTGIEKIDLTPEQFGTAVLEIHKDKDGISRAAVFCSEETATMIEDVTRKMPLHCILHTCPSNTARYALSIPIDKIIDWDERHSSSGYVIDGLLA